MKKIKIQRMAVILAVLMNTIEMSSQIKMAVLSDIHVMAPELLISDGDAWQGYLAGDRRLVDYSRQLFDKALDEISNTVRPDYLIITGDLTKDGEAASHYYVKNKLDLIASSGIRVFIIPGNHDWGTSYAKYYDGATETAAETLTMSEMKSLYSSFEYGIAEHEETTMTWCCEPDEGLVLIGIDSGANGILSETTLSWVCDKARRAYSTGKQVIALMHHPLIPHFTGVEDFVSSAVINSYETVRNRLADAGVRVILTGHFHTSDIAKDFNANFTKEITDINTGSLVSYPCHYRVLTLSSDKSTLSVTTECIEELEDGDGFADIAKGRLKEAVENQVRAQGAAYSTVAPKIADAFIYHAEGDEHRSAAAATTLTQMLGLANVARMFGALPEEKISKLEAMANSMLRDISQYQVEDRQNQTDDLILNITLPSKTVPVSISAHGIATFCSDRYIDMSRTSDLKAFIITGVTDNDVTLEEIKVIPPGTGVVLYGTPGNHTLYVSEMISNSAARNRLVGTLAATNAPAGTYVLSYKNGKTGFFPISTGVQIPLGKAYLP